MNTLIIKETPKYVATETVVSDSTASEDRGWFIENVASRNAWISPTFTILRYDDLKKVCHA